MKHSKSKNQKVKLNLGCGDRQYKDYINIDLRDDIGADIVCDCCTLTCIEDNSVDKIIAFDILEHFSYLDTEKILETWVKKLKNKGDLIIKVPDMEKLLEKMEGLYEREQYMRVSALLFGRQDYEQNQHRAAFTKNYFEYLAKKMKIRIRKLYNEDSSNNLIVEIRK